MTENERIKEVRKSMNLTMEKFGQRLGVTKTAISNIEKGNRNVTEQMRKAICREYNVDLLWLESGLGDMFATKDEDILDIIDNIMTGEKELHKNLIKWVATLDDEDIDDIDRLIKKYIDVNK